MRGPAGHLIVMKPCASELDPYFRIGFRLNYELFVWD